MDKELLGYAYMSNLLALKMKHHQAAAEKGLIPWQAYNQFVDDIYNKIDWYKTKFKKIKPGAARARLAHQVLDSIIAKSKAERAKDWATVSCKSGCFGCCMQMVEITSDEADLYTKGIRSGKLVIDRDKLAKQAAISKDPVQWWLLPREEKTCVFLKDGKCGIYDMRPLACRKYHVSSDPVHCESDTPGTAVQALAIDEMEIFASAMTDMDQSVWHETLPKTLTKVLNQKEGKRA